MTLKAQPSRLTRALLETADDMRAAAILDEAAHEKITLRHLGTKPVAVAAPITGEEIGRVARTSEAEADAAHGEYLWSSVRAKISLVITGVGYAVYHLFTSN